MTLSRALTRWITVFSACVGSGAWFSLTSDTADSLKGYRKVRGDVECTIFCDIRLTLISAPAKTEEKLSLMILYKSMNQSQIASHTIHTQWTERGGSEQSQRDPEADNKEYTVTLG